MLVKKLKRFCFENKMAFIHYLNLPFNRLKEVFHSTSMVLRLPYALSDMIDAN